VAAVLATIEAGAVEEVTAARDLICVKSGKKEAVLMSQKKCVVIDVANWDISHVSANPKRRWAKLIWPRRRNQR
jgi:hypothetical protein